MLSGVYVASAYRCANCIRRRRHSKGNDNIDEGDCRTDPERGTTQEIEEAGQLVKAE